MKDTSDEINEIQRQLIMKKTTGERFMMAIEMYEMSRAIVETSIKNKQPSISALELKKEVFRRFYSTDFSESEMQKILDSF